MAETNEWADGAEVASNWFKFEKIGDGVRGTLIAKRFQKSNDGVFPDQWVYELKKADGSVYNVGISVNKSGTIQRLNNCKIGELIGILFESEGEQKKKGFAPAKNLKVLTWGMDPNYSEMSDGDEVEAVAGTSELPPM